MYVLCVFWMDFLSIFGTGIYREEGSYVPPENVGAMGCHYFFTKRLVSAVVVVVVVVVPALLDVSSAILSATSALKAAARLRL